MARVNWAESAVDELDQIAEYIALDNPAAAQTLVREALKTVDRLECFPESGREPPELPGSVYREILCRPCRIFYRQEDNDIFIIHVMREERQLRQYLLGD